MLELYYHVRRQGQELFLEWFGGKMRFCRMQRFWPQFLWQLVFWILTASTAIFAQPPHIISTVPSPNQLDVEPTVNISATFNVDMNSASFSDSTLVVFGTQTGSHLGRIEYHNATQTVTFDPIKKFAHGEEVTVVLTSDIKSSDGYSLKNCIWSFTVEAGGGGGQFDSAEVIHDEGIVSLVSVLCADLDGDEKIDVAVLGWEVNSFIFILWNDGDKRFSLDYPGSYGDRVDLSAGDLDRDGDVDLAVLETDINSIWVLSNNGDRTFTEVGPYDAGERPLSMYGNDLDGDGDIDLAVSNYYSDSLSILFNNGKGSFPNRVSLATDQEPQYLTGGDLDSDGDLDLVTAGGGLVTVLWNEKSTPVQGPFIHDEIPDGLELSQNYPNPFNSETVIRYQIPDTESGIFITLKIYNLLGEEVITLVEGEHRAGYYEIKWDGTDMQGKEVGSGIYFYEVKSNNFDLIKKLILLK